MGISRTALVGTGVAVGGYLLYQWWTDQRETEQALIMPLPTTLGPGGLSIPGLPGTVPAPGAVVAPGVASVPIPGQLSPAGAACPFRVAQKKPGVIAEVRPNGKLKKLGAKKVKKLLPAQIMYQGRLIPTPREDVLGPMEAQQDLAEYGVLRGWLLLAPSRGAAPKWVIPGKKKKIARKAAANHVRELIVLEACG